MPMPAVSASRLHSSGRVPELLARAADTLLHRRSPRMPGSPAHEAQLLALSGILDEAVAAQPLADRAVAACGETGPVVASAAQEAGLQISVYHRLIVRLRELNRDGDIVPLAERASRLLAYHEWILHQSVNLAFTAQPEPRIEAARLRLDGLGRPAAHLRELRDEVRRRTAHSAESGGLP